MPLSVLALRGRGQRPAAAQIQRQLKDSNLPAGKTLESLDDKKLPDKIRRQLPTLLEADFVRRGDNLLCFGLAGRGKTHLVCRDRSRVDLSTSAPGAFHPGFPSGHPTARRQTRPEVAAGHQSTPTLRRRGHR